MLKLLTSYRYFFISAVLIILAAALTVQSDPPQVSYDGLYLEDSKKIAVLYVKPNADFRRYKKFIMLDAHVAFRKNWQRDTKVAGRKVSNKDMLKIQTEVAGLFHSVFSEGLQGDNGYPMVKESGDDVLVIRPALIDLDITAPDIPVAGRVKTYVASAGAATLYLELYDSVSGEILARIVDRRKMRSYGTLHWASSVSNRADAKRMLRRWAKMLRDGFDEMHADKFKEA